MTFPFSVVNLGNGCRKRQAHEEPWPFCPRSVKPGKEARKPRYGQQTANPNRYIGREGGMRYGRGQAARPIPSEKTLHFLTVMLDATSQLA